MKKSKFVSLTENEIKSTQGGWLLFVAGAFVAGTAYGYVKEKLDSGQW
jgi:lactobin A/cerein 7B family class IIb bacteriocin